METNIVFLGNVPPQCDEKTLYDQFTQFGPIKRIKIFCETFQSIDYSVGYAMVEFSNHSGYISCTIMKHQIMSNNCLIHIHPSKPDTRFGNSVFVFFNDPATTRESILEFFINLKPLDVRVRSEANLTKLGFAIVEFPSCDARDMAISLVDGTSFRVVIPSQKATNLTYQSSSTMSLHFTPNRSAILDPKIQKKFMDIDLIHLDTPYQINSFLASIHSKRIHLLLLSNTNVTKIETRLHITGPFEQIALYLLGQTIEVNHSNAYFIYLMASDLEITSLAQVASELIFASMTPESALQMIKDLGPVEVIDGPHIRYMANHVDLMKPMKEFLILPVHILAAVFRSTYFHTNDSTIFAEWLIGYIGRAPEERKRLLQFLPIQSVSRATAIQLLTEGKININYLRDPILSFLQSGLTPHDKEKYEVLLCPHNTSNPMYGIFSMLIDRCGGNPVDYGIVNITSNANITKIIDMSNPEAYFSTAQIPNSWLQIDFKSTPIWPTGYTIWTSSASVIPHSTSWVIEGSNDELHWALLSDVKLPVEPHDDHDVTPASQSDKGDGEKKIKLTLDSWRIEPQETYRYLRLRQTDLNSIGNHCLFLSKIEFTGLITKRNIDVPFNNDGVGVFSCLTKMTGGNPAENGTIELMSSSDPKFLIEPNWDGSYRSAKQMNSWILFDFLSMKVNITNYTIQLHYGASLLLNWIIEASTDGKTWLPIHNVKSLPEAAPFKVYHFACSGTLSEPCRFVKFTMVGASNSHDYILWLKHIEFYGGLLRLQ